MSDNIKILYDKILYDNDQNCINNVNIIRINLIFIVCTYFHILITG